MTAAGDAVATRPPRDAETVMPAHHTHSRSLVDEMDAMLASGLGLAEVQHRFHNRRWLTGLLAVTDGPAVIGLDRAVYRLRSGVTVADLLDAELVEPVP